MPLSTCPHQCNPAHNINWFYKHYSVHFSAHTCALSLNPLSNVPLLRVTTFSQSICISFKSPHYTHTHLLQISSLHPHILSLYIASQTIVPWCLLPSPSYLLSLLTVQTCIYHPIISYFNLVEVWYSLEQYIGLKEDKLSSTTVDFIRSEGNLETKHLYWFSKPKMC